MTHWAEVESSTTRLEGNLPIQQKYQCTLNKNKLKF